MINSLNSPVSITNKKYNKELKDTSVDVEKRKPVSKKKKP